MVSNKTKNLSGFTLIELLAVIAIIGVLMVVIFASLNNARLKARNVQRNNDVKQLVNAFNLGFSSSNSFPTTGAVWRCISATCYGANSGFVANATVDNFLSPYIIKPADPVDPTRPLGGYIYNSSVNPGGAFTLGAYIMWYIEPPLNTSSCGVGALRTNGGTYLECVYKLD